MAAGGCWAGSSYLTGTKLQFYKMERALEMTVVTAVRQCDCTDATESESRSVVSDSLWPNGLSPWTSPARTL